MNTAPDTAEVPATFSQRKLLPGFIIGFGILVFVVIGIALCEPLIKPRNTAFKSSALHDEQLIITAIAAYHSVYGKYPVDPDASGVITFSRDNSRLFDVLRNRTGVINGNPLNPNNLSILRVPSVRDEKNPRGGIQTSTGIWFDPWGSPYHIAIKVGHGAPMSAQEIPDFYTDAGALGDSRVIVWSYGENGRLGGGQALKAGFTDEPGTPGNLAGSDDMVSWR